jgi:hypothetical protein
MDEFTRIMQMAGDEGLQSNLARQAAAGDKSAKRLLKDIDEAVKGMGEIATHGLDVTFAMSKSDFGPTGQKFLQLFEDWPILLLAHPFPRFLAASTKFLYERSPFWLMKSQNRALLGSLNKGGKEAITAAGHMAEGVMGILAALYIRSTPELRGDKWYQVRTPLEDGSGNTRMVDMRAFAPLSTSLFIAEGIRKAIGERTELQPKDVLEVVTGIKRIANTGLGAMMGVAGAETGEEQSKLITGFIQDLASAYTTPLRGIKDVVSIIKPEEGILRDKQVEAEFGDFRAPLALSKAIADIPFIGSRALPEADVSTRAEPLGADQLRGQGALRQGLGITLTSRTPLETEMSRLGLNPNTRTGVKLLDRKTDQLMGLYVAQSGVDDFIESDKYVTLGDFNRRESIQNFMAGVRAQAKAHALQVNQNEIVDEIVRELSQLGDINQVQRRLSGLLIPENWKQALLPLIENEMTPKSVTGSPIPALAGLRGESFNFVSRHLPMRISSIPQGAQ